MTRARLRELLGEVAGVRTLVVGDAMLDEYIWGTAERVSPEAPVLVVRSHEVTHVPGGAANVIHNVLSLGARAGLVAVRGADHAGETLARKLYDLGAQPLCLLEEPDRPTTVKTRVLAHHQQVVRIDHESRTPLPAELGQRLVAEVDAALGGCAGLLLSDYDKGVLNPDTIPQLLATARRRGCFVAVNAKPHYAACYHGADLLTVNRAEAAALCGYRPEDPEAAGEAAAQIRRELGVERVLVTLSEDGLVLADSGRPEYLPALEVAVSDPAGAGDTTVATLHLALCAGAAPREALDLARRAAAVVVRKVGVQTATPQEIVTFDG